MAEPPQTPAEKTPATGVQPERREDTRISFREQIPQPSHQYRSAIGKWLARGESIDDYGGQEGSTHRWYKVMWLTGVDYFSTLGYQPGIALLAAGALRRSRPSSWSSSRSSARCRSTRRSPRRSRTARARSRCSRTCCRLEGQDLVLVLLGFAATDFVITMTLSAADAAKHAIENPFLQPSSATTRSLVTLVLLGAARRRLPEGLPEAIGLAPWPSLPVPGAERWSCSAAGLRR